MNIERLTPSNLVLSICTCLLLIFPGGTNACADGPDFYRVIGVEADDVLNVRSGPGLMFSIIGSLPYDATNVQNRNQVPVNACDGTQNLTTYEKNNFWTEIVWEENEQYVFGWVKSRFLAE